MSRRCTAYAAASARLAHPVFCRIERTWLAAVCWLMNSRSPISRFEQPSATRRRTSSSRSDIPSNVAGCRRDLHARPGSQRLSPTVPHSQHGGSWCRPALPRTWRSTMSPLAAASTAQSCCTCARHTGERAAVGEVHRGAEVDVGLLTIDPRRWARPPRRRSAGPKQMVIATIRLRPR